MSQTATSGVQAAAEAARWFARLASPQCTASEREACERWLAADPAHPPAFIEARNTANSVSAALRTDPRLQAMARDAQSDVGGAGVTTGNPGSRRLLGAPLRVAAAVSFCVLTAALFTGNSLWTDTLVVPAASADYANSEHRVRRVDLADGTHVYLDAGAEVAVTLTAKQRRVTLVRGRAYFDVAHDRSRPFAVNSAGTVTTALGTRFEVDVQRGGVRVTLAQGSIAVAPNATQSGWRELLRPGEQLRIPAGSGERERLTLNADRQVAWSQGRLEFDGTPLREALEIFNRYAAVKVLLGDEDLADTLIGGSFSAGADSESFVRALSAVLPMHGVRAGGDEIVLFHGRRTDGA
jgi:transmembrane sensor